jgi:hypothetical protein
MKVGHAEDAAGRDVGKANQRVHGGHRNFSEGIILPAHCQK